MEPNAVEVLLSALQLSPTGWRAAIPAFTLFGQPLEIQMDTRSVPLDTPPEAPDSGMLELARLVLVGLGSVLAETDRQYRRYHAASPAAVERAYRPRIWLSENVMRQDGKSRWTLVVGIEGAEDYGTHAEFDGLVYHGLWSGD